MDNPKYSQISPEVRESLEEHFEKGMEKLLDVQTSCQFMYIRHLVFMNGGALVALLSSKAVLISNEIKVEWTSGPMAFFSIGLVLTAILNAFVYFRLFCLDKNINRTLKSWRNDKIGFIDLKSKIYKNEIPQLIGEWVENALGLLGLISFIVGAYLGISHFR